MARNTLRLDTSQFSGLLTRLDSLGGNVKITVDKALGKASSKISADTVSALDPANLPAGGKYSKGSNSATRASVIRDANVRWEGSVGWVPVGFDFSKPGAGGYLITGTPRMKPDVALNRMYKQKKYMQTVQDEISHIIIDAIIEARR